MANKVSLLNVPNAWHRSIRVRVVLFILLSGLLPLFIVGWIINRHASDMLVKQHLVNFRNLAQAHTEILESHIGHLVEKAEILAKDEDIRSFFTADDTELSNEQYRRAGTALALTQESSWGDTHHFMLVGLDGLVRMSPPHSTWTQPGVTAAVMRATGSPHSGEMLADLPEIEQPKYPTALSDLFGFEEQGHLFQLALTPVLDEHGQMLGLIATEITIATMLDKLGVSREVGDANRIFLATTTGKRIVDKKSDDNPEPMLLEGLMQSVEQGDIVTGWFRGADGKRVLGTYAPSPANRWVICFELPEDEAMADANHLTNLLMLVFFGGLVALAVLAYLVGSAISVPIRKLVDDSGRIAQGDVWHEIRVDRSDEVGQIQYAVEEMRVSLKQQIDHLDAQIAERTADLEYANEQLAIDASQDKLTGLANRQVLLEFTQQALTRFKQCHDHNFAVLFFDFDRFKIVNDSLGHATGDALLCSIADRFRKICRDTDLVARFGGDEFVVCLGSIENAQHAMGISERLLHAFEAVHEIGGHRIVSTASIGLVISEPRYNSADEMIRDADAAMYEAKLAGKGQIINFDEKMHHNAQNRMLLEEDLSHSIERNELRVFYQPIIGIEEMSIEGFEALIRWEHPKLGLVQPDQFVPIIEDTGFIVQVGEWILRESLMQLRRWDEQLGTTNLTMNVNVAKRQLIHPNFITMIRSVINDYGIAPERLKLEITESTVIDPRHDMSQTIRDIHRLGVKIAMDDFGTGHSSLSLLHKFDLDVIKIDKSFIQGMSASREMRAVLHAIIALAQNMGKAVVAEGAETKDQIACLISHGCDMVQGYYFAKPLNPHDAQLFINTPLRNHRAA